MLANGSTAIDGWRSSSSGSARRRRLFKRCPQFAHRLKTLVLWLLQTPPDDALESGRRLDRPRVVAQYRAQHRDRGRPAERPLPGEQFVGTAPKLKMSDRASSGLPSACSGDM